jgi:hypothetical protein
MNTETLRPPSLEAKAQVHPQRNYRTHRNVRRLGQRGCTTQRETRRGQVADVKVIFLVGIQEQESGASDLTFAALYRIGSPVCASAGSTDPCIATFESTSFLLGQPAPHSGVLTGIHGPFQARLNTSQRRHTGLALSI